MKAPLFAAALLLATPVAVHASNVGSDDPNMAGTTNRMFIINATTPGGLTFSGAGTATFNNSVGTSNQFNVGSNTSIGVNANISATQEFDGASVGIMTLSEGSNLMQTNGTSSSAASTQSAASAANTVATETAQRESHAKGWETATANSSETSVDTSRYGSYNRSGGWEFTTTLFNGAYSSNTEAQAEYASEAEWSAARTKFREFKNSYETAYNENYDSSYSSAYSNVITNSASTATESAATGIIKGEFLSTETPSPPSVRKDSCVVVSSAWRLLSKGATQAVSPGKLLSTQRMRPAISSQSVRPAPSVTAKSRLKDWVPSPV